ncbi:class I SAM-dependent DNA methyltransferase [Sphingomonas beigongshangi]|uniref:class I SAM-dependent DNA methyltransferase n=1 Tax=Sphingomonas beigongshangi TaxID=2782540 RepID=UPI001AEF1897|nr:class I SAM-dependent DNA methyltransferase [Sphingomonas beigongshangi]
MADDVETIRIDRFIERWRRNEGGAERANYVLFLTELCDLLGLDRPDPAEADHARNDYVFERAVTFHDGGDRTGHGRIDLYKKGCFVLEAKQSREPGGAKEVSLGGTQATLPGFEAAMRGRRSAHRGWDVLMRNAREQAEQYARALPESHGWPPFILVADVGHAIEVFADFSGQGKNYRQFPDRGGYRIYLDDLRRAEVRARLVAIWTDPQALDPARRAATVTRDIAGRLARVSKRLEDRGHDAEAVAHFLMRCLFTMFAEDTGLLERGCFTRLLAETRAAPEAFAPLLEGLWAEMNRGGFSHVLHRPIRRFNGGLFADARAIALEPAEIGELHEAARHVWTEVEPAIFGTLLEQALDARERRRLGAHYTPRAYVERLVVATVIAPLQREWEEIVLGTVERERSADPAAAIRAVHDFHEKLAGIVVLDPACGTGNFLYVALELMKRLEGDVLEVLADLGGQEALALETATVHPRHFLGIEVNPRAAAIAELVLWLGYLQWQIRNGGTVSDPVLETLRTIEVGDAILRHEGPAAGRPTRPAWPEADYIVGNPPFIGGKDIRARLGDAYATALWKAHPKVNRSADYVMYWWDRAAERLTEPGTRLKRFGFVTTNSITQTFSRRVIARRMAAARPVSLVMAIADHPWTKATRDAAAVRIAMSVAEAGVHDGVALTVTEERGLDSDAPEIGFAAREGRIHADFSMGVDLQSAQALVANRWLCSPGVKLHGAGFIVTPAQAEAMGRVRRDGLSGHIRPYLNGRDLVGRPRGVLVIDLLGLPEEDVRQRFPDVYQHLLRIVRPERLTNARPAYRDLWWVFGEPRRELRAAFVGLRRYIATVETAKHRIFQFLDADIVPDNMLVCVASDDPFHLGVLSSRISLEWTYANSGLLGVATFEQGHRYTKSAIFDPFPFPDANPVERGAIVRLAEELDALRRNVVEDHDDLTPTRIYNLIDMVRRDANLSPVEEDQRRRGHVDIIAELHDRIDVAVADAYGWPVDLSAEEIVARLVALNAERRTEERRGKVRWLRPSYQIARAGLSALPGIGAPSEQFEAPFDAPDAKPRFPRDAVGQTAAVFAALRAGAVLDAAMIARGFAQGRKIERRVAATLEALARLGHVARDREGYRLRRAA